MTWLWVTITVAAIVFAIGCLADLIVNKRWEEWNE